MVIVYMTSPSKVLHCFRLLNNVAALAEIAVMQSLVPPKCQHLTYLCPYVNAT